MEVVSVAGRRPILDEQGRMRSELPPTSRGFTTVTLRDKDAERLAAYMERHGIKSRPAAIAHMLDRLGAAQE